MSSWRNLKKMNKKNRSREKPIIVKTKEATYEVHPAYDMNDEERNDLANMLEKCPDELITSDMIKNLGKRK